MNIEIANRLVELRKKNGLSQEQLAEKIGVSRQAVSKWERSEASPDTDNIILLARIYGMSLDELLKTDDDIPKVEPEPEPNYNNCDNFTNSDYDFSQGDFKDTEEDEYTHFGPKGIHVKDGEDEVHISWKGIHVKDKKGDKVNISWKDGIHVVDKKGDNVNVSWKGVKVNDEEHMFNDIWIEHKKSIWNDFPYAILTVIAYLLCGFLLNAWATAWLVFLTVPLYHGLVSAIEKRNANHFPYPILVTVVFLAGGMFHGLWHPLWVIYITVPIYYWFANGFKCNKSKHENSNWNNNNLD